MKLEVGMYVRHERQGIGKIMSKYEENDRTWFDVNFKCYEDECHCGICE